MLPALPVILVYLVGTIAILVWAVKHYCHDIKPALGEIVVVTLFAFSSVWNTSDRRAVAITNSEGATSGRMVLSQESNALQTCFVWTVAKYCKHNGMSFSNSPTAILIATGILDHIILIRD